MHLRRLAVGLICFTALIAGTASAQGPESIDGELVVVPILLPGAITIDGDLGDWAAVPEIVTTKGTFPSADPTVNGELRWQLAATTQNVLHFAATITDDQITAGQDDTRRWNEDSIEFYLNFADPTLTQYGDSGIVQVRISAVDVGNTDPSALTLTGIGVDNFDFAGHVFETEVGWGLELAVNIDDATDVIDSAQFGVQVQANGASGGDRDLKLIWSNADVDDTSFEDPSVFGTGQFVVDASASSPVDSEAELAQPLDESDVVESSVVESAVVESEEAISEDPTAVDTAAVGDIGRPDDEPEPRQTLFVAAIISAVSVLLGGLYVERRRKKSEEKMAAEKEEDVEELIASILDADA